MTAKMIDCYKLISLSSVLVYSTHDWRGSVSLLCNLSISSVNVERMLHREERDKVRANTHWTALDWNYTSPWTHQVHCDCATCSPYYPTASYLWSLNQRIWLVLHALAGLQPLLYMYVICFPVINRKYMYMYTVCVQIYWANRSEPTQSYNLHEFSIWTIMCPALSIMAHARAMGEHKAGSLQVATSSTETSDFSTLIWGSVLLTMPALRLTLIAPERAE